MEETIQSLLRRDFIMVIFWIRSFDAEKIMEMMFDVIVQAGAACTFIAFFKAYISGMMMLSTRFLGERGKRIFRTL